MATQVDRTDSFETWRLKTNQIFSDTGQFSANIANLQTNVAILRGNVSNINSNLSLVYANITTINSNVATVNSNLSLVYANITTINSNVATVNSNVAAVRGNVSNLQSAVVITTNAGGGNVDLGNVSGTRIRITNAGAVGIGTLIPRSNLEVEGGITIGNTASTAYVTLNAPTGSGQTYYLPSSDGTAGNALITDGAGNMSWKAPVANTIAITYIIDGGTSALTTGIKGDLQIPFKATIVSWSLLADQAGTAQVDIWKSTYGNFSSISSAGTIATAQLKPRLNSQASNTSVATNWTTAIAADDILRYNIDATSTIKRMTITLTCYKT